MDSSLDNECEIVKVQKKSRVPEDVTFHDAKDDCYPVGQDVRCSYKILASLKLSSYDWVGLFKAGSSLPSEYVHYEWSPLPKDYVKGTDVENAVVFPGHRMPTEDGKLYQFSYISASGKTCGTSKPFWLKMLKSDEFLESTEDGEEEEKDGELVVIETKTLTLEAKIREATEENRTLKEKLGYMDDAAACVVENQNQLEEELRGVKEQIEQLKSRLQVKTATAESRELENQTLELCIVQLEEKVSGLNKENSQLLDRTVAHDAYVMELEEELMESRMKYSDVMDQLLSTTNLCEEYKCQIAAKENEFKELDLKLGALDEEKEKMMRQLSDNTVLIDHLESCVAILTGSRNELMKRADRVEEENRHFQASTFVSLKVLSDQQREAADRMKSDLEKRLLEETATSARMMKMAEELKEKLLRHLLEKEKEDKIHQQERAKLEKCVAEHKASSLRSEKQAAELKEQLQKHLAEREREMKAAEIVKEDLEKQLTEEMASSQRSKKLADELMN